MILSLQDWLTIIIVLGAITFILGTLYYLISDELEYRRIMKGNNGKQ